MSKTPITNEVHMIPVASIIVDEEWNPRKNYQGGDEKRDSLEDLKTSIEKRGLLQPVMVRKSEDGTAFKLIAGFRRMRAVKALGLDAVPATVREVDEPEALVDNVIENVQREQLTPAELAIALHRLKEMGMSGTVIAKRVGLSKSYVNMLTNIRANACDAVWEAFEQGKATVEHARKAVGAGPDPDEQLKALHKALGMVEDDEEDGDGGDGGDGDDEKKEKRIKRPSANELGKYVQCLREMAKGRLDAPKGWTEGELRKAAKWLSFAAGERATPPFALPKVDAGSGEEE